MTPRRREPIKTLAIVAAALGVTAAWLAYGPSLAAALAAGTASGAGSDMIFTIIVFAPLLAAGLAGGAVSGIPSWRSGQDPIRAGSLGLALGLGGLLLATGYAALAGTLVRGAGGSASIAILAGLIAIGLQVTAEEVLFRGWLQPLLARVTAAPVAIGATAVAFAALHLLAGASGVVAVINLTLGGVLFGILAAQGGGIAGAFGAHLAWNVTEQLVFGLDPNPGAGAFGAIIDLELVGKASWGGSADGLNASWAMTIALCAVVVPLIVVCAGRLGIKTAKLSPSPRRPI